VLACFDSTKSDDIPASNFPMNPTPASRCSAAAGYRGRWADKDGRPPDRENARVKDWRYTRPHHGPDHAEAFE